MFTKGFWLTSALSLSLPFAVAPACAHAQIAAGAAAGLTAAAPHLVAATPAILTSTISSGSAHVGQAVLAKLANPAALSNGLKLPQGTQLLGKVTQVKSLGAGKGTSSLAMIFDHLKTPDGKDFPLSPSMLKSVGSGSSRRERKQEEAQAQAQTQTSDSGNPEGGLLGGVTGAVGSTVNGVTNATGQLLGTVTGLPGVLLDSTGTLNAKGKNVTLEQGTEISVQASASAQSN